MSRSRRGAASVRLGLALAGLGAVACGDPAAAPRAPHPALVRVRLGALDEATGRLVVWDVSQGGVAGVLELGPGARLRAVSQSGAYAAFQRDGEPLVRFAYGGVAAVPHRDHVDLLKGQVELLPAAVEAGEGAQVVGHAGAFGFASRAPVGGAARPPSWLLERALRLGPVVTPVAGVVARTDVTLVPLGEGGALVAADGALSVVGEGGVLGARLADCTGPVRAHGSGGRVAVSCGATLHLVDAPPGAPPVRVATTALGAEPSSLERHPRSGRVLARTSPRELAVVDPPGAGGVGAVRRIGLDFDVCQATFEILGGDRLVLLGSDAGLRTVGLEGEGMRTTTLGAPFSCGAARPPTFAHVPEHAYVALPDERVLVDVDLVEARVVARVGVDAVPDRVVAFGMDATNADRQTGED